MEIINFYKSSYKLFTFKEDAHTEIQEKFTTKQAIYAFIVLNIITSLINGIIMYGNSSSLEPLYSLVIKTIIGLTLTSFIGIIITTIIFQIIIKMFKAKNDYASTLKDFISALIIPTIILSIISFIVQIIYIDTEIPAFDLKDIIILSIYAILNLIIIIWYLIVLANSLSKTHEISKSKIAISYAILATIGLIITAIAIGAIYLILKSLIA